MQGRLAQLPRRSSSSLTGRPVRAQQCCPAANSHGRMPAACRTGSVQQGACGRCAAHLLSSGGRRCSSSGGGGRRCLSLLGRRAQQQVQCGQLHRVGRPGFPHARDRQAVRPGDRALSRCTQSPVFHQGLTSSDNAKPPLTTAACVERAWRVAVQACMQGAPNTLDVASMLSMHERQVAEWQRATAHRQAVGRAMRNVCAWPRARNAMFSRLSSSRQAPAQSGELVFMRITP